MQKDQRNGENRVDEDRRGRAGRTTFINSALLNVDSEKAVRTSHYLLH